MQEKKELRKNAKEIRNSLDTKILSERIVKNILDLKVYQDAKNVMIFYPLKHEVDLLGLLADNNPELHPKTDVDWCSRSGIPARQHKVSYALNATQHKNFYLPKVSGSELIVCPYKKGDELIISEFQTKEPITNPVNANILDIVFVPALMIDKNYNRLGYGGGFYDRFLSKNALSSIKIVAIPSELMTEEIPSEHFDVKIDIVVTELTR